MARFGAAPAVVAPTDQVASVLTSLVIDSNPSGADIEIDGAFVGNTPSTIGVAAGSHQIAVKKTGSADWVKTLTVTGGAIRLSADPGPAPTI